MVSPVVVKYPNDYIRLKDIAAECGWGYGGDGDFAVHKLRYAEEADQDTLAVAYSERDVESTKGGAILTEPRLILAEKNFIRCNFHEIGAALAKVGRIMVSAGLYPDYEQKPKQQNTDGAMVGVDAQIGKETVIEPFVSIGEDVVIGKHCRLEAGVFIGSGSRIGDNVTILAGSRIGVNCHYHYYEEGRHKGFIGLGRTIIRSGVEIGANTVIQRGSLSNTIIGENTVVGNLVEIAHDVKIGNGCLIVSQVGICGRVVIGDGVQIYGQAGINERVHIGDGAVVLAKSVVTKNISAGRKVSGMFARDHVTELRNLAKTKKGYR